MIEEENSKRLPFLPFCHSEIEFVSDFQREHEHEDEHEHEHEDEDEDVIGC
jgi:hypothetical protein